MARHRRSASGTPDGARDARRCDIAPRLGDALSVGGCRRAICGSGRVHSGRAAGASLYRHAGGGTLRRPSPHRCRRFAFSPCVSPRRCLRRREPPARRRSSTPIFTTTSRRRPPSPCPTCCAGSATRGVATILATSRPNDGTRALVAAAMARSRVPRRAWSRSSGRTATRPTGRRGSTIPAIYALIETELARAIDWRGIGEFHVFGRDADTPWVKRIVALAVERGLWLHAHCDDAALEILFAHDPRVRIIWAHSGFSTPPAKIAHYLERHPDARRRAVLSLRRDRRRQARARLASALPRVARSLRARAPTRGSTSAGRATARSSTTTAAGSRSCPADVAAKIARGNGERLFPPRER